MKLRFLVRPCLVVLFAGNSAVAQTFNDPSLSVPATWLERVELQPGRTFDSLIFQTIPGVDYAAYASDDLLTWTPLGQHYYGLGQQVVIPMVERLNPTGTPPVPPEGTPVPDVISVSLVMSRIPGGLSLSFLSADSGVPIVYPLAGLTIPSEWDNVPLYASPVASGYSFAIFFSGSLGTAPATTPVLGTADQAMVTAFTTRFPSFSTEVQANVQRTRSLPPAPYIPGDHRFYRVTANPYLDSDDDGTPDWLEFASTGSPTPGAPASNPLNGDTNGNGIPDGQEKDSDGDGIRDDDDVAKSDAKVSWAKNELLLFAAFPIETKDALQVNDQGMLLTPHSLWSNGNFVPLLDTDDHSLKDCSAYAMSDNGMILGTGTLTGSMAGICQVWWSAAGGAPRAVKDGADYLVPVGYGYPYDVAAGVPSDIAISADGVFIAYKGKLTDATGPDGSPVQQLGIDSDIPRKAWQLKSSGTVSVFKADPGRVA